MIEFKNVSKVFGRQKIIDDLSFTIKKGELVALVGESGCGKTTTLKMINTLVKPTSGKILINNENILEKNPIALRRNIGYVIQQTGLFPHMTIRDNIEIIARAENYPEEQITKKTESLMSLIELDPDLFLDRYPSELSGGQQQRIGVARAFSCDPNIILMDEPFSALDPITRSQIQEELVELHSKLKTTIVFVTHDMDEAIKIADRICVMHKGNIAQYDVPEEILKNPVNDYVRDFVGEDRIWSSPELIRVKDVMLKEVVRATPEMSVRKCLQRMLSNRVNSLVVTDRKRKVLGYIPAKSARSVEDKGQMITNIMQTEFFTVHPEETLTELLEKVTLHDLHNVPVVDDDGYLKGIITQTKLINGLSEPYVDDLSSLSFREDDVNV